MAENEEAPKEEAKPEKEEAAGEAEGGKKGGSMKIILIAGIGGLLVVGLAVTTTLLLVGGNSAPPAPAAEQAQAQESDAEGEEVAEEGASEGDPQFFPIRPAIVVNIPSKGRIRFLQVQVDIMSRDDDVIEDVEAYAPLIKNELVSLFSQQTYENVVDPEGKERLRKEALARIQKVLSETAGVEGIEQVLFTSFVTQ